MNLQFVSRAVGATKLLLKDHGPTLMVVGGVAAMGGAAVMVGKKSLQLNEVLEPHVTALEKAEGVVSNSAMEVHKKDVAKAAGFDVIKLYSVPTVLFVGGACLVFGGHRIMVRRNATLAIAFTGLQKAYDAYRANTRAEMGEEFDQAMLHGYKTKEIVNEDGSKSFVNVRDWDEDSSDPYNRIFEQGATTEWVNDLGINKMTVANQQRFAQELLNRRGYLYLREVYHALGFPETPISHVVGWKVRRNPDGSKDFPVVDFGLDKPLESDWIYSNENAIYLDFNCQGLIVGGMVQKILEQA